MKLIMPFVILFLLLLSCEEKKTEQSFDLRAFEMGKSVGRNAMFMYIGKHTNDTIRIEITELLKLEDSLATVMRK